MLQLAYNLLKDGGWLIVKTQDIITSNGQLWISHFVIDYAIVQGFTLEDKFILVAQTLPIKYFGKQKHARKYHSYFLVFKK